MINTTGSNAISPAHFCLSESFIMPQIQIGFRTIISHINFPVLKRIHRPRVYIDVGVQFENGYFKSGTFQQTAYG